MRYALVTGGSRGIGRAICIKLAAMGYPVVINYLGNQEAAEATKSAIEQMGGTAQLLRFDISNPQAIEEAIEMWENSHPNDYIAVLVNNAGIRRDSEWHNVIDTTLNGFFYTTRRVLKGMMTKRFGRIINITSLSGLKGMPGQCNYSAAKAALIGATKALAQEVAPRKVTVNAVAPGFIESDMTKELPKEELAKMVPMKRFGKPEEVASLVGFLAGEESSYITGEVISINGGLL